jgi:hypothetical protein
MIAFINNYSLHNMKNKLLMIYILNITDIAFTLLLLSTGYFIEANLLLKNVVQNPTESFVLKVVLPALLLIYLYIRIQKASDKELKKANHFISGITVLYLLINISHLLWCSIFIIVLHIFPN